MRIRPFQSDDAEFCFKIRASAFIHEFYDEIGPEAVAAGVNAYMPGDYIRMAQRVAFFIIEEDNRRIGFFTVKRVNETTAELPLIYLDLNHLGKGIGSQCIRFMEEWILSHWTEVDTFFVDTVIPEYNGAFYQKMGFAPEGEVACHFPDLTVSALRLSKRLETKP